MRNCTKEANHVFKCSSDIDRRIAINIVHYTIWQKIILKKLRKNALLLLRLKQHQLYTYPLEFWVGGDSHNSCTRETGKITIIELKDKYHEIGRFQLTWLYSEDTSMPKAIHGERKPNHVTSECYQKFVHIALFFSKTKFITLNATETSRL